MVDVTPPDSAAAAGEPAGVPGGARAAAGAPAPADWQALPRPQRRRRLLLWVALLALMGVAQSLLLVLTVRHESAQAQDEAEAASAQGAIEMRRGLLRATQALQSLAAQDDPGLAPRGQASALLRERTGLERLELRGPQMQVLAALDAPLALPLFSQMPRSSQEVETLVACAAALRTRAPTFSRTYFVPMADGQGFEVMDLCIARQHQGELRGFLVGTFVLVHVLETLFPPPQWRSHEISVVEPDGTRLARAGNTRGAGIYVAERAVDLPGTSVQLRADSTRGQPSVIPNLATALVLGLSLALFALVFLLARDVRRRALAEQALAEALAFRRAMEDSLSTGLRARDLQGVVTYANPAFCAMVGFDMAALRAAGPVPPYWPPEAAAEYAQRQHQRLRGTGGRAPAEAREGFETVFMRHNGERFPVMIYEAPLVDGKGRQTGWMSAIVDLSAQRRVEDLSRQQHERLQASARLATVGEMASLLSHELNQPLAAIASYASGSLNLLQAGGGAPPVPPPDAVPMLQQALQRIAEQAERAGRVIRSVHDFVRRREHQHESVPVDVLLEAVLPLARLQARKSGTRIEVDLAPPAAPDGSGPAPRIPRVRCDRTMVEQVLLNLTRNGIQAMESDATPHAARVLTLRVRPRGQRWVGFAVIDAGPGVPPEVAERLFTPFFTTRSEGMGLGLSLCRTVVEQHGGHLEFAPGPGGVGTEFRFTLPAAPPTSRQAPGPQAEQTGDT